MILPIPTCFGTVGFFDYAVLLALEWIHRSRGGVDHLHYNSRIGRPIPACSLFYDCYYSLLESLITQALVKTII